MFSSPKNALALGGYILPGILILTKLLQLANEKSPILIKSA